MSALGLGPTLAWRHRVHRSQKYRTLLELKAFFYQTKLKRLERQELKKGFLKKVIKSQTAKIRIVSALGLGPTLAWRHRVHRSQKIPNTFGVTSCPKDQNQNILLTETPV